MEPTSTSTKKDDNSASASESESGRPISCRLIGRGSLHHHAHHRGSNHHLFLKEEHESQSSKEVCLCCIGVKHYHWTTSEDTFMCPWCNRRQSYKQKVLKRSCHLCFIPLFPLAILSRLICCLNNTPTGSSNSKSPANGDVDANADANATYIKCAGCHKHFQLQVLNEQHKLAQDILENPVLEVLLQIFLIQQRSLSVETLNLHQEDDTGTVLEKILHHYHSITATTVDDEHVISLFDQIHKFDHANWDEYEQQQQNEHESHDSKNNNNNNTSGSFLMAIYGTQDQQKLDNDNSSHHDKGRRKYFSYRLTRLETALREVALHLSKPQKQLLLEAIREEITPPDNNDKDTATNTKTEKTYTPTEVLGNHHAHKVLMESARVLGL